MTGRQLKMFEALRSAIINVLTAWNHPGDGQPSATMQAAIDDMKAALAQADGKQP